MNLTSVIFLVAMASILPVGFEGGDAQVSQPIPVGIRFDAEGPDLLSAPPVTEPTAAELKALESLVVAQIRKHKGVEIVSLDYPQDYVFIGVVVGKLPDGRNGHLYVASSVYTIATKAGKDEFVSHNVLAGRDLPSLSNALAFQFASMKLRATLGLWK